MAVYVFIVISILLCRDALKEYKATKYANKQVYKKDTLFFSWMLSHHPFCLIHIVLSVLLFIILLLSKII